MIDKLIIVAFHVCTHLLYVILTKSDKDPWICCKSITLSGDSTFYSLQQRPPAMPPLRIILALIIQGTCLTRSAPADDSPPDLNSGAFDVRPDTGGGPEDDRGNGPVKLDIATWNSHNVNSLISKSGTRATARQISTSTKHSHQNITTTCIARRASATALEILHHVVHFLDPVHQIKNKAGLVSNLSSHCRASFYSSRRWSSMPRMDSWRTS